MTATKPSIEELTDLLATDFMRFVWDNFQSTEQHVVDVLSTGEVVDLLHEKQLLTGVANGSFARFYYNNPVFNPQLSELFFKLRLSETNNLFAFWGVKLTTAVPTFDMTESHAGFMYYDDGNTRRLFMSTGDSDTPTPHQQRVEIKGWDVTNWLLYKMTANGSGIEFWMRPTPIVYPYFGDIRTVSVARQWAKVGQLASVAPLDQGHYGCAYIGNTAAQDKRMYISHVVYGERYAD